MAAIALLCGCHHPPARVAGPAGEEAFVAYKGFGGVRLIADMLGDDNDPAVLLLPDAGKTRAAWRAAADALVLSGRRVVTLHLRETGETWSGDDLLAHVEDLRAVLAQLGSRPVVVAARRSGWIAARALAPTGRIWRRASSSSTCRSTRTPPPMRSPSGLACRR